MGPTMSAEPLTIEIAKAGSFDGTTLITLTRDDFAVTGQRYYRATLSAAGGMIGADLFGLFLPQSVKLVGVAGMFHNPGSTVKVVTSYASGRIRQEVDLTPDVQYVVMYPGDLLVVRTAEPTTSSSLVLVANELTESDHIAWASHQPVPSERRRFRIYHPDGDAFVAAATTWEPDFAFSATSGYLYSEAVQTGGIPCAALSLRGLHESVYVRVRFAGIKAGTGEVVLIDGTGNPRSIYTSLDSVEWSGTFVMGYDDKLGFNAEGPDVGGAIGVDIEVVHVLPGDHLAGRWANDK